MCVKIVRITALNLTVLRVKDRKKTVLYDLDDETDEEKFSIETD